MLQIRCCWLRIQIRNFASISRRRSLRETTLRANLGCKHLNICESLLLQNDGSLRYVVRLHLSDVAKHLPVDGQIDSGASDVFPRLLRFYKTFNLISALISGLSLAILSFNEFHPATSEHLRFAESLLVISISTSVTSIMLTSILLFGFEGYESVTWNDLALAWVPLVTLDCSIFAFLVGMLLWCAERNDYWRIPVFGSIASMLVLIICWAAINTYSIVSRAGGLNKERNST